MMETCAKNPDRKKRQPRLDRVTLQSESLARLESWMTELRRRFPGIRITRSDLTNWVIQNRPVELTLAEHREVQKGFYDDLHFTAWALKELKSAQERGEKLSLKEIFERNKPLEAIPRKPRRKEPPTVASEVPKS